MASLTWLAEPGFPYAHQVVVRFELSAASDVSASLVVTTTLTALDGDCVPISFGWHPYFRRGPGAAIDLPAVSVLQSDGNGLPTGAVTPELPARTRLSDDSLDYGVSGLSAGARMGLENPAHTIAVAFDSGYRFGQIFAPSDAPVVSLEPMTAPTDALGRGTDLPTADAAHPYVARFTVTVTAAGA